MDDDMTGTEVEEKKWRGTIKNGGENRVARNNRQHSSPLRVHTQDTYDFSGCCVLLGRLAVFEFARAPWMVCTPAF